MPNDSSQRIYEGNGERHYKPKEGAWEQPEPYIADTWLVEAVNAALYLNRPLLLEGEPGCGKTRLAYAIAYELGYPLHPCYIRSTSKAQDLLYEYDALRRLYDLQEERKETGKNGDSKEYDLNLMSLDSADAIPTEGNGLVIVAKIGNFYHVRIFDRTGNKVIDKGNGEFLPDEMFVQQLEVGLSNQPIDNQTKNDLIQKITSSLERKKYVDLGKLGQAIALSAKKDIPSVVLIDEIDKADIDFPNDLLELLDEMKFSIKESEETIDALKGQSKKDRKSSLPLFVITSNREKELPQPFLRRCLFYYIEFPNPDTMREIVKIHTRDFEQSPVKSETPLLLTDLFESALAQFWKLREKRFWRKLVGTSELLDWIRILEHEEQAGKITDEQLKNITALKDLPHLETLIKTQSDLDRAQEASLSDS